jgi:uncharacterized membrane protein YeaQ/YmgE (transglycosylase-associated protein family)
MNSAELLITAIVAVVCGTIAQLTSGYSRGGLIVNIGVGFLGALAGVVVSRSLNAPVIYDLKYRMIDFPIIYSLVGCALFLAAIGLLVKPHRR